MRVFIDSFRKYLVSSYAQVLTQYTDQTKRVNLVLSQKSKRTVVLPASRSISSIHHVTIIKLEFKLRKDKKSLASEHLIIWLRRINLLSSKLNQSGIPEFASRRYLSGC
ncbi:ABC transporter substrate-binding protein [Vibrio chagasii]|nr:ABC transporter substrate-binding protein [Vibrio chagasii]